jgi:DNA-directed RNA polymerase sigma subunit (sigma70/sigma32)
MASKRKKVSTKFWDDDTTEDDLDEVPIAPKAALMEDELAEISEKDITEATGLSQIDEVLLDDIEVEDDDNLLHPAEVAAKYQATIKGGTIGGSDEQILKDLRKMVFAVPLLHQEEVHRLFIQIDQCIFPAVHSIMECSVVFFGSVIQVVTKVAAGNTYGKNIYEKEDAGPDTVNAKGTYKAHEMDFLVNAYKLIRMFADSQNSRTGPIKEAMERCLFIRGVYEDVLHEFTSKMRYYDELHWMAYEAKQSNQDEYRRICDLIARIDEDLELNRHAFYISRDARHIYTKYMLLRSTIIAPYLRTAYSAAKSTARNPHQMLDNFQNGSIGLMRAVSCYSTRRPASFASVAKWWIKQMMLLSIKEDANFVKLPVSTWQAHTQLEKARSRVGASEENMEAIALAAKVPVRKVKSVYHTVRIAQVYSLNRTYDADEKLTLEDIMTDDDRLGGIPDELLDELREHCLRTNLVPDELRALALRHGMIDILPINEVDNNAVLMEATVQNLAKIGFHYKVF